MTLPDPSAPAPEITPSQVPGRLRTEYLSRPTGVRTSRPRLSWWLPTGAVRQHAYRIRAGAWDSGRVESGQSTFVPYEGPELLSGQHVGWQVKVWTDLGESDWSLPAAWEMGLLHTDDWQARWIAPDITGTPTSPGERPAFLLRGEFAVHRPVTRARLHITAHGIYEAYLNGTRVGDAELTPGFTAYHTVLQVQTYDVTTAVRQGGNTLGAVLSDGWYRSRHGLERTPAAYGDRTGLLAQLVVEHPDGTATVTGTGPGWRSRTSAVTAADLMDGQHSDLRREPEGWSLPQALPDPAEWAEALPLTGDDYDRPERLADSPAPPVRRVTELAPVSVTDLGDGRQVVDFGQNINGWVRLTGLGPRGTTLTLTHGEALDPKTGDVTMDHLAGLDMTTWQPLASGQIDQVISAGTPGEIFEPRHTTHGFRYVRVEGSPGPVRPEDNTAVVVHTDLERTGWFRCSDPRINRLHEAAVWSFRGNACDIPTDCPQRERAGWTGDWQIFAPTAAFLYDVSGFSAKWLRDLAADQRDDGAVRPFTPDPFHNPTVPAGGPAAMDPSGAAGWGDAAVLVPWEMWRAYGDEDLLRRQYPSMKAWVDFAARSARTRRHPDRAAARPDPAAHEQYLWDTGFQWGEWLEPDADIRTELAKDQGIVATAYLHHSARTLARIAGLLGHPEDATAYRDLADHARHAWQAEYLGADGTLAVDTQATYVRALAFDLLPTEARQQATDRLTALIRAAGTHLATGFLATPYLLPVLADAGNPGLAYELLLQNTAPSWLAMTERGATTIWEDWNGIDADGNPHASLNHYSKGAVISFLHTRTAGLRPDDGTDPATAGYRHLTVAPQPGGGLTWAEAAHDTPYGRAAAHWHLADGRFHLTVDIPPGTTADIHLPDGTRHHTGPGHHRYAATL